MTALPSIPPLSRVVTFRNLEATLAAMQEYNALIMQNVVTGSTSAPGVAFAENQATGLRLAADGGLIVVVNGVDVLTVSGDGTNVSFPIAMGDDYWSEASGFSLQRLLSGSVVTPSMFGAIGDGASHPLSGVTSFFGTDTTGWTLVRWQKIFPRATAMTQEIDYLAHDAALQAFDNVVALPGTYRFGNDTLTLPSRDGVRLYGSGRNATEWVTDSATADVICFASTAQSGQAVSYGTISSNVAKTAGAGIKMTGGHMLTSRGITFGTNMYNNYLLLAWTEQFNYLIEDFEINSGVEGIVIGDGGMSNVVQNLWIQNGIIYNTTSAGIRYSNVSGFYVDNVDIGSGAVGHYINPAFKQTVTAGWFSRTGGDTMTAQGILIYRPAGWVNMLQFRDVWVSNCSSQAQNGVYPPAIQIDASAGNSNIWDISFDTLVVQNNGGVGISLIMGKGASLFNPQVFNNGKLTAGGAHGIYANCDTFQIIGGNSGPGGGAGNTATTTQDYGLVLDSGCLDYYIAGINLNSNTIAGAQVASEARGTITGCENWRTRDNGSVVMVHGSTSVTVTTDMGPTVDKNRVMVSLLSYPAGAGAFWVSAVSTNTFTISCETAPTADVYLSWAVDQERY